MTPAKKDLLKKQLYKLLEDDLTEECESPWKNYCEMRLCVDYRLSAITVLDTCILPRLDDLLHVTKKSVFLSTLDLRTGYHQTDAKD